MTNTINEQETIERNDPVSISIDHAPVLIAALNKAFEAVNSSYEFSKVSGNVSNNPLGRLDYIWKHKEGLVPGALRGVLKHAVSLYPDESVVMLKPSENKYFNKILNLIGVSFNQPIYLIQDNMPEVMSRPLAFNKPESVNKVTSNIVGGSRLEGRKVKDVSYVVPVPSGESYRSLTGINKIIMGTKAREYAEQVAVYIDEQVGESTNFTITPTVIRAFITKSLINGLFPGSDLDGSEALEVSRRIEVGIQSLTSDLLASVFMNPEDIEKIFSKKHVGKVMEEFSEVYQGLIAAHENTDGKNFLDELSQAEGSPYREESHRQVATNLTFEASIGSTNYALQNLFKRMAEDVEVFDYVKTAVLEQNKAKIHNILRAATLDNPPVDLTFREVSLEGQQFAGKDMQQGSLVVLNLGNAVRKNVAMMKEAAGGGDMRFIEFVKLLNSEDGHKIPEEFEYVLGYPWNRFKSNDKDYNRQCWGEAFFLAVGSSVLRGIFNEKSASINSLGDAIKQSFGPTSGFFGNYRVTYREN